jgi:hypothetical protein
MQPTIHVRITSNTLGKIKSGAPAEVDRRLRMLTQMGLNKARQLISESPPTGAVYPRGTITHVASSPGNPPRIDTGNLINSIYEDESGPLRRVIGVGADTGEHLEFGTDDMQPRPFMGPMAQWLETQIDGVFQGLIE